MKEQIGVMCLYEDNKTHSMTISINKPDGETSLEKVLRQTQKEFEGITFTCKAKEKKLVPFEIVLDVTIKVATGLAVAVLIKALEKLWKELNREELTPQAFGSGDIQASVERYLVSNGVADFKLLKRKDKGPYVEFVYKDGKGYEYMIVITSFDLKILSYERKGRK
jgi:hypothetical protein